MGSERRFNRLVAITRQSKLENNGSGTNFNFDIEADSGFQVIIDQYSCCINEAVRYNYDAKETGDNYSGSTTMKGVITDSIQEGDIVDGKFKVVGEPKIIHGRYTQCNIVRL